MDTNETKPVGPAIGVIIIVLVVVLGGLYFWGQHQNELKNTPAPITPTTTDATTTPTQ